MTKTAPAIPHLGDRAQALAQLGWTGRNAEWIALVCLHSGVFTRSQFAYRYNLGRPAVLGFVRDLVHAGITAEHPMPGRHTPARYCHLGSRPLYRALGAEHIRHRKRAGDDVLFRRLLSLDYVIERPDLPWLPTESEKVEHFESLGIDRGILPRKPYGQGEKRTLRYFGRLKLPLAADGRDATFVYVDPGNDTDKELRTWARDHEALWVALRSSGGSVKVVAVVRTLRKQQHYAKVLKGWVGTRRHPSAGGPLTPEERELLLTIEAAMHADDDATLDRWGGFFQAAAVAAPLRRRADLPETATGRIESFSIHLAERISDDVFAA